MKIGSQGICYDSVNEETGSGPIVGFCDDGDELLDSIITRNFLNC